jgi:hypothetical protein
MSNGELTAEISHRNAHIRILSSDPGELDEADRGQMRTWPRTAGDLAMYEACESIGLLIDPQGDRVLHIF